MNTKPPLVLIAGPTASGKSALALALARHTPSTIINMDASQVYADLRILSARPSAEEEAQAPHKLFGTIDGLTSCTAARWANDARAAIAEAHAVGRLPILVGGTGLYMRTLLDGIAPVPEIEPQVRAKVRAMAVTEAYAALELEDVEAAARLAPADTTRVARALEVVRATGRTLKAWQGSREGGIAADVRLVPLILLPPREWLMARCDARFAAMIEAGALEEVAALLARGLDPALPVMRAIGVRELGVFLQKQELHCSPLPSGRGRGWVNTASEEPTPNPSLKGGEFKDALTAVQLATRQFAKRQYTWFRNQCPLDWWRFEESLNNDNINNIVIKLLNIALTR